jgi:hypothetical protein
MVGAHWHFSQRNPDVPLDGAMHDAVPAIAALGVSPIVRLPDQQGWMVKRKIQTETSVVSKAVLTLSSGALDSGAHGVSINS